MSSRAALAEGQRSSLACACLPRLAAREAGGRDHVAKLVRGFTAGPGAVGDEVEGRLDGAADPRHPRYIETVFGIGYRFTMG